MRYVVLPRDTKCYVSDGQSLTEHQTTLRRGDIICVGKPVRRTLDDTERVAITYTTDGADYYILAEDINLIPEWEWGLWKLIYDLRSRHWC